MHKAFKTKVVGLTFVPSYPRNLLSLREAADKHFLTVMDGEVFGDEEPEPMPAVLVRNPNNEFDHNAIEVHIPSLGSEAMVGHLPRNVAEKLAPELDEGVEWCSVIDLVAVDSDHPENPGLRLALERAE